MLFLLLYALLAGPVAAARLVCSCLLGNTNQKLNILLPDKLEHYDNYLTHHSDVNIVCCQLVCH